jgi:hypothetical protein
MPKIKTKPTRKSSNAKAAVATETDSTYLLKLVLYIILGSQWLWLETSSGSRIPIPIGLIIGTVYAMHDHFQIDRKIEYAVLLIAMLIGFVANMGIFLSI